jgi:hypothetical protein
LSYPVRPTYIHYNCVLNGYAKCDRANKALLANTLLNEMKHHSRLDCHPDTTSYNTVLAACANAGRTWSDQSFAIALDAFKTVVSDSKKKKMNHTTTTQRQDEGGSPPRAPDTIALQPTSTTFAQFAKASRRLLPRPQQHSILAKTMLLCLEWGVLHKLVVQQGQLACRDQNEWQALAGELNDYVKWQDDFDKYKSKVPTQWTANARR